MKTANKLRAAARSCAAVIPTIAALAAQQTVEQRLDRLERENAELKQRLDGGAGPAGSALSFAGYGEFSFTQNSGRTDIADAYRAVLYAHYRFDERWSFHSEVELEHASTSAESGGTDEAGEVSLEFGYLEYAIDVAWSLRAGLVLVPLGLVNEDHEPTRFLAATRSLTETRIVPTTWSELGVEAIGTLGCCEVRGFFGTGLDGEEFGAAGLRDGRQHGNRVAADDFALALRADCDCGFGLRLGAGGFYQQAGQDGLARDGTTPIPELDTGIAEVHAEWRHGPWQARGLFANAFCDDAAEFDAATGEGLAERLAGWYCEAGCDVATWWWPDRGVSVIPFVRYERIDTQADVPAGVAADPAMDSRVWTFGVDVKPDDRIVFKVDFENRGDGPDRFHVGMGYVF